VLGCAAAGLVAAAAIAAAVASVAADHVDSLAA
jgi:hypothetical protein